MTSPAIQKCITVLRAAVQRLNFLPLLGPFLLGPLLYHFDPDPSALEEALKRYIAFLLLVTGWEILRRTLIKVRLGKEHTDSALLAEADALKRRAEKLKKKQRAKAMRELDDVQTDSPFSFSRMETARAIGAIVLMLTAMQLFRGYFNEIIFFLLLLTLTCSVLGDLWGRRTPLHRKRYLLALSPKLLYFTGIGYLSCLAVQGSLYYQPLVLAAGMASMALAPGVYSDLIDLSDPGSDSAERKTERKYLQRALGLLFVLGPLTVALLVYSDQLPMPYLLIFASLAVGSRLLQRMPRDGAPVDPALGWLSTLTSLTFLGVFLALRVL